MHGFKQGKQQAAGMQQWEYPGMGGVRVLCRVPPVYAHWFQTGGALHRLHCNQVPSGTSQCTYMQLAVCWCFILTQNLKDLCQLVYLWCWYILAVSRVAFFPALVLEYLGIKHIFYPILPPRNSRRLVFFPTPFLSSQQQHCEKGWEKRLCGDLNSGLQIPLLHSLITSPYWQ